MTRCSSCEQMKAENKALRKALNESSRELVDARNEILALLRGER